MIQVDTFVWLHDQYTHFEIIIVCFACHYNVSIYVKKYVCTCISWERIAVKYAHVVQIVVRL